MAYRIPKRTKRPPPSRVTVPLHPPPVTVPGQRPKPPSKKKFPAPAGYIGGWAQNPNLSGKKYKTVKTGRGYYIAKKLKVPPKTPGMPKAPVAPKPPPGPYDSYPDWAKRTLTQMDTENAGQQQYGLDVQKWLSGTLAPIQAAGQAASANYKNSIAGLPNAGNMSVPQVQGMSAGGVNPTLGSPDKWKTDAAATAAAGYNTAEQGQSAISSFLADSHIGNLRSALETNFAEDLLRLSADSKKEKNDYMSKLDQFLATSQASALENAQNVARQSTNDWYDFIAQLTNAGVKIDAATMKQMAPPTGSGGVKVVSQTQPTNPAYDWVEESPGVWRGTKLPTPPKAPAATKPTGLIGPIANGTPLPKGYVKVKSGGKTYWRALGKSSGTGGGGGVTPEQRRVQFTEAKKIWVGDPAAPLSQGKDKPGLNKGTVTGFTGPDGSLAPNHTDGPSRSYVFNVRAFRLREQILAMTSDKNRTNVIMKGILGNNNFKRFIQWWTSKADGPLTYKAAVTRRHV